MDPVGPVATTVHCAQGEVARGTPRHVARVLGQLQALKFAWPAVCLDTFHLSKALGTILARHDWDQVASFPADAARVVKKIADVMDTRSKAPQDKKSKLKKVAEDKGSYQAQSPEQLSKSIAKLEKQMMEAAKNLEFEQAARYRDEIAELRAAPHGTHHSVPPQYRRYRSSPCRSRACFP